MCKYSVIKYCSVYESDSRVTLTEESGRCIVFEKNECAITVLQSHTDDADSEFLFNCYGVLGSVSFLGRHYLVLVTEAAKCGRLLLEHDVYTIRAQRLIPLFHPVTLNAAEKDFVRVFNDFDISNNFYFSYSYNLANSLQLNLSYSLHLSHGGSGSDNDWMIFDPVVMYQKYCYNFSHKMDLCSVNQDCFNLSLFVIHGYFSECVLNVSGRSMSFSLISRRSRFFSGTRYRKRGIIGSGYVANDVETEQILHDWGVTRSASSFVLMRGSIPIFWSQDPNEPFLKPPIIFPHNDPTNASVRTHFKQLLSYYGAPLVVLNLLSDNPYTEEGNLSERYRSVVDELNTELPAFLKIMYFSKNIKSLLEKGVAKQMLKEVVDVVLENIKLLYIPQFKSTRVGIGPNDGSERTSGMVSSINTPGVPTSANGGTSLGSKSLILQSGIIRVSCLDCLDRTSAFAKHLSLRVFKYQLQLIGINANYEQSTLLITNYTPKQLALSLAREESMCSDSRSASSSSTFNMSSDSSCYREEVIIASDYFGFNQVKGLLFELVKDRYERMCDELSMQYAGSKALRKYEGRNRVFKVSELFTTVKRRYRNYFEDTRIQVQTNFFLYYDLLSYYAQIGINIIKSDLDDLIHFKPIPIEFNNADSFVVALIVFDSRTHRLRQMLGGPASLSALDCSDGLSGLYSMCELDSCSHSYDPSLSHDSDQCEPLQHLGSSNSYDSLDSQQLSSDADRALDFNAAHAGFNYSVYRSYFQLLLNTGSGSSESHTPLAAHSHQCAVHREIEIKKKALEMILTSYLTIQDQDRQEYVDFSHYKPSDKLIDLINTEPLAEYSNELTARSSIANVNSSSLRSDAADQSHQASGISLKDNRGDYSGFLVPKYTYSMEDWSLELKCNVESLRQYINVQT